MSKTTNGAEGARPVGRILRFLMGGWMIYIVTPHIIQASLANNLRIIGAILGLLAVYVVIHLLVSKYLTRLNRWLGAIIAFLPALALFFLGGGIGQVAALTYVGGSLIIDSLTGDAGCEVMAVPGLLFRKRTHLACVVFSPLDWVEEKIYAYVY